MNTDQYFHPEYARAIAKAICYDLIKAGAVERIKIVGGLRRGDETVQGASLLYISNVKVEYQSGSQKLLFDTDKETRPPKTIYLADSAIEALNYLDYRINENGKRITITNYPFGIKAMIDKKTKVPIDFYPITLPRWGMAMIEKTGPAAFVKMIQEIADAKGYRAAYGKIENKVNLEEIFLSSEAEVLKLIGLEWIEPKERRVQ